MATNDGASSKRARRLSDEHKAALSAGRRSGAVVRRYLDALEASKPRPGRRPSPDRRQRRLAEIEARLPEADILTRLHLIQERLDLGRETDDVPVDLAALEAEFVKVARAYSASKGISYKAWRSAGIEARVLQEAGITRSQ